MIVFFAYVKTSVLQDYSINTSTLLTIKMSNCDATNFVSHVQGFHRCFQQLVVEVADSKRFPTDIRDGNGFSFGFQSMFVNFMATLSVHQYQTAAGFQMMSRLT